jgi:PHD/YefM family antitoxin component YafN of YafNO toxin-antitoxin module
MMLANTDKTISSKALNRELAKKLRSVSRTKEPLFVLSDNMVAAVIVSPDEYAALKDVEEVFEHFEIYEMVRDRMKHHETSKNVTIEEIKGRYGL